MEIIGNRRNFYSNLQRNSSGQIALKKRKKGRLVEVVYGYRQIDRTGRVDLDFRHPLLQGAAQPTQGGTCMRGRSPPIPRYRLNQ